MRLRNSLCVYCRELYSDFVILELYLFFSLGVISIWIISISFLGIMSIWIIEYCREMLLKKKKSNI